MKEEKLPPIWFTVRVWYEMKTVNSSLIYHCMILWLIGEMKSPINVNGKRTWWKHWMEIRLGHLGLGTGGARSLLGLKFSGINNGKWKKPKNPPYHIADSVTSKWLKLCSGWNKSIIVRHKSCMQIKLSCIKVGIILTEKWKVQLFMKTLKRS